MNEQITKESLQRFFNLVQYWRKLLERKQVIIETLSIHGVSYSDTKVSSGNSKKLSEQERYVIALERINNELSKLSSELEKNKEFIKSQLRRMTNPISSKIIQLKYIDNWHTWEIIEDLYIGNPKWNPNMDLEEFKKSPEYEAFRNDFYKREARAISELEKLTGQAFVPNQNQLRIKF